MVTIDFRVLDDRIREHLPAYATAGAAGMDLRACIDGPLLIVPGDTHLVPTGIAIHVADPGIAGFATSGGHEVGGGGYPLTATGDVGIGNPFLGGGAPRGIQLALKVNF